MAGVANRDCGPRTPGCASRELPTAGSPGIWHGGSVWLWWPSSRAWDPGRCAARATSPQKSLAARPRSRRRYPADAPCWPRRGRLGRRLLGLAAQPLHVFRAGRQVAGHPLQAVHVRWIPRRGDNRTAGGLEPGLGVIDHRRGQLAQIDAIDPRRAEPIDQCGKEIRRGAAEIAPHHELGRRRDPSAQHLAPASIDAGVNSPANLPRMSHCL